VLVVAIVAGLSWWLTRYDEERVSRAPEPGVKHEPDAYFSGIELTEMDARGRPAHRLVADYMAHFPDNDTTEATRPRLTVYRGDAPPWELQSDNAVVYPDANKMLLAGAVLIAHRDRQGDLLEIDSSDVWVDTVLQSARSDQFVELRHALGTTNGVGFEAYMETGQVSLLSNVTGSYEPAKN
jgi:lipopolysaccharide export system protein LptC